LLRKFIYGPGIDEPICLLEVAENNAVYYYHFDGLGSVVALSDVNSVLVERYTYDVFGRPTIRDANGTEIAASAFANPYLFTGRAYDAETGLYYYRARYYDYATGRFLQPDPIGYNDGLNLYAYVANNPLAWTDPLGLETRRQWTSDAERRQAIEDAVNNSTSLKDFVNKYDPTFGGPHGYDLFNLEIDTTQYGNVDVDWMITLLAAHYGRAGFLFEGMDPGITYAIAKRYWIIKDAISDPDVDLDFSRYGQENELAAIRAARDLIRGKTTLSEMFDVPKQSKECKKSDGASGDREYRRGRGRQRGRARRNDPGI
jgi:RHS repeat-associated protein